MSADSPADRAAARSIVAQTLRHLSAQVREISVALAGLSDDPAIERVSDLLVVETGPTLERAIAELETAEPAAITETRCG